MSHGQWSAWVWTSVHRLHSIYLAQPIDVSQPIRDQLAATALTNQRPRKFVTDTGRRNSSNYYIFSHFIILYFIKTVGLTQEYYNTLINIFGHVLVGHHARVKSGSRCWGSPGLLMFVTSPPPIRDGFSVLKFLLSRKNGLSTDVSTAG